MNQYISPNNLDFLSRPSSRPEITMDGWIEFRVGTCHGLYRTHYGNFQILVVMNDEPGNGHFGDAMGWFENSCKRDRSNLQMFEFTNDKFRDHMINKWGFVPVDDGSHEDIVEKSYIMMK